MASRDTRVLVKEYQLDPVDHQLLHADFYRVAMDKLITVTVPIVLKGEARGVKQQGGIARLRPPRGRDRVPAGRHSREHRVDVTELMLGQGVRLRDLLAERASGSRSAIPT